MKSGKGEFHLSPNDFYLPSGTLTRLQSLLLAKPSRCKRLVKRLKIVT